MRRAVLHMMHGARARAFVTWHAVTVARTDALAGLESAAYRWRNQALLGQWAAWKDVARERHRQMELMRGTLGSH